MKLKHRNIGKSVEQCKAEKRWSIFCEKCGALLPKTGARPRKTEDGWRCLKCIEQVSVEKDFKMRDDRDDIEEDEQEEEVPRFNTNRRW